MKMYMCMSVTVQGTVLIIIRLLAWWLRKLQVDTHAVWRAGRLRTRL